ncbi:MAG: hypothetical protein CL928_08985 [Deltaproteobacteria bacterium]|nr:hypothetical protein [Deltaproteobacteria bacterium]
MNLVVDEVVSLHSDNLSHVFHVPTSSLYAMDSETMSILEGARDGLHTDQSLQKLTADSGLDPAEVEDIIDNLVKLRLLVPPGETGNRGPLADRPQSGRSMGNLVLHVAHTCNLGCGYCYAEQGLYKGKATLMNEERAHEYVDWLFDQCDPETKSLGITFFGGEPLLNLKVMKSAAAHARERADTDNKSVRFSVTTNGTLVTPEIVDFLAAIDCVVTVSLDGIGKTNDRLRPFHSGRGSYDLVLDRIQPLLERGKVAARVTVTRQNLDVVDTVTTLLERGFAEVGCSPVDAKNPAYDLRGEDYEVLLDGFGTLSRRYIDEAVQGRKYGFSNIANIIKAVHQGHNKDYPCGAGLQMVAGAPNGEMSLCHRFVGEPDYVLGNVKEGGIDSHRRLQILEDIQLSERSDCSSCWARYICSGGCHHVNFLFEGDPSRTYLTHCDYLRAWYRMGLEAYAEIMSRNPEFVGEFIDPGFLCNQ